MRVWKRICCAVDLSPSSRAAMETAADLAAHLRADLVLLYVNQAAIAATGEGWPSAADLLEETRREEEPKMDEWRVWAEAAIGRAVQTSIVAGRAAERIVRFVNEERFDLLVIGTHGRVGVARFVLGSVSEEVQRRADCPVLVVKSR